MAYCAHTDVTKLTNQQYGDNSQPLTSSDVSGMIALADSEIDAVLSDRGLTVPSSVPSMILLTSQLLSAAYVEERVYTGRSRNESSRAKTWRSRALGPKFDETGKLGGVLKSWIASQNGASSGPRFQSEYQDTSGENAPQFTRDRFA